ncbi:MAG: CheR family methyltransferase [Methylophilaceae bacterium]
MDKEKYQKQREFTFTENDFSRIRKIIYQHAGIALSEAKDDMVYSRVARRLRAIGYDTFKEYLNDLERQQDAEEWEAFTNALTTNLTSFFREEHHFPILADHLLTLQKPIRLWCNAASTGEEPYTLAITACEAFGSLNPPVEIIATDIDTNVLETAAAGVYAMDRVSHLSAKQLKAFFHKGTGAREGSVKVRSELQRLITFSPLNLLEEKWPVQGPFDAIFCRNVMIYFDKPTQSKVLERFTPLMKAETLLFAGHSENFIYVSKDFQLLGRSVYQLKNNNAATAKKIAA